MRTDYAVVIGESETELAALAKRLRGRRSAVRVQMLSLLKRGEATSLAGCAHQLGYSERQLKRWWATYRQAGLSTLLDVHSPPGQVARVTAEAWVGLEAEMRAGHIARLEDARSYLRQAWGIEYRSLGGVWYHFRQRRVKLKTGRRRHRRADAAQQAAFKKLRRQPGPTAS